MKKLKLGGLTYPCLLATELLSQYHRWRIVILNCELKSDADNTRALFKIANASSDSSGSISIFSNRVKCSTAEEIFGQNFLLTQVKALVAAP